MELTLSDAARRTGKGKSTLLRAVKSGKLSARRTDDGAFMVDAAELARVFVMKGLERTTTRHEAVSDAPRSGDDAPDAGGVELAVLRTKVAMLEAQLEREQESVTDLRKRLDRADEQRIHLLTSQSRKPHTVRDLLSRFLRRSTPEPEGA